MCHVNDALRGADLECGDIAAASALALRLAQAAERDEDCGFPDSWRRVHALLFGGGTLLETGLAHRIETLAAAAGRVLGPRPFSVAYADEVRGFARSAALLDAPHGSSMASAARA